MKLLFRALLFFISLQAYAMDKYCNGAPTLIHANGGGHVAITTLVSPTAYVGIDASVCEFAMVFGSAEIRDESRVYGLAKVNDGTIVSGEAEVSGNAVLHPDVPGVVTVTDLAEVFGNSVLVGSVIIKGNAQIFDNARISSNATIDENAKVFGNATVTGNSLIKANAKIHGKAFLGGDVIALGDSNICDGTYFEADTILDGIYCSTPVREKLRTLQVSAGYSHTCSLYVGGKLRCWGKGRPELGYGTINNIGDDELPNSFGFIKVGGTVTQVVTGSNFTCVLLDNGNVKCWGYGGSGSLGYGNTISIGDDELPTSVGFVSVGGTVTRLAAGGSHVCALLVSQEVVCWGNNMYGQLGYGHTSNIGDNELPSSAGVVDVGGPVIQISAGGSHTCALLDTGSMRCWGNNNFGQLGRGNMINIGDNELPSSVAAINFGFPVFNIASGGSHNCIWTSGGVVKCWGNNGYGQLGYGNTTVIGDNETLSTLGNVSLGASPSHIIASGDVTCALLPYGKVRCWGVHHNGVLGLGYPTSIGDNELPSSIPEINFGPYQATQVSTSGNHVCVVLVSGMTKCWGQNIYGQLGLGNTDNVGDNEVPASVDDVGNSFVK